MNAKHIAKKFRGSKKRLKVLNQKLEALDKDLEFIRGSSVEESRVDYGDLEAKQKKYQVERRELEHQIIECTGYIATVNAALEVLKEDLRDEENYEMFYLKYFKNETYDYLSVQFEFAVSNVYKKVKIVASEFETLMN